MNLYLYLYLEEYFEACLLIQDEKIRLALYDKICNFGISGKDDIDLAKYNLTLQQEQAVKMKARSLQAQISTLLQLRDLSAELLSLSFFVQAA